MLILSSALILVTSLTAYFILVQRSYIKNVKESICVFMISIGLNFATLATCLYYAHYTTNNYLLNRFFFLTAGILKFFRKLPGDVFLIGNLLTISKLFFVVGMYCFCAFVVDGKLKWRDAIWLWLPLAVSLMNLSGIYVRLIRLAKIAPYSLYKMLQIFDWVNRLCAVPVLIVIVLKLIRYYRDTRNDSLRKSVLILLLAVPLIWVEFLLILDLTPSSAANVYSTPFMMKFMNGILSRAMVNPMIFLLCLVCVTVISFSFGAVIFASIYVIKQKNYQKVVSIEIDKSIFINDVQNLIPFIHSLKNQLVSLAHFEEMLGPENHQEVFSLICSLTEQMNRTIDNIYENSRELQLHIGLHNVCECIQAAVEQVQRKTDVPIVFRSSALAHAMVDSFFLQHALENLLYNAADACEGKESGLIEVSVEQKRKFLSIYVRDNGVGIPKQNMKKLTDPFFSTKKYSHSWGMGLNHVNKIVNAHGGRIRFDSEVNVGTTVSVMLPTGK